MIGLGVGIDYTLFIVTRFRQLLHDGLSPQEAAAAAGATAGRAVIFAGTTVAISITGLALIGIDFITKLGIGSALGVLTAVLLANSLLPAVLSLLGHKIDRGRLGMQRGRRLRARARPRRRSPRWGRFVTRNAKIVLPVASWCCWSCSPRRCCSVRLGLADAGTAPKSQTTRKAYDLLSAEGFGPGFTSPIPVVIDLHGDHQAAAKLQTRFKQRARASPRSCAPIYNAKTPDQASVAIINAYSKYAPQDAKTDDIVSTLRDRRDPARRSTGRRRRPTCRARTPRSPTSATRSSARLAVVPAVHHRRHLPRAGDGVPLARDRDQGRADDAGLGAGRASAC